MKKEIIISLFLLLMLNIAYWTYFNKYKNNKDNRFFLVSANYNIDSLNDGNGFLLIEQKTMPSYRIIDSTMSKMYKAKNVVILSIFEFKNESDYKNFSKN